MGVWCSICILQTHLSIRILQKHLILNLQFIVLQLLNTHNNTRDLQPICALHGTNHRQRLPLLVHLSTPGAG